MNPMSRSTEQPSLHLWRRSFREHTLRMLVVAVLIALAVGRSAYAANPAAQVKDINTGTSAPIGSTPSHLVAVGSALFFIADDGVRGSDLWKSDGPPGRTVLVKDILAGATGSSPATLRNVGGTLFFSANDGSHGVELWKSDGTLGGTVLVKDIASHTANAQPDELTDVNGTLYFAANDNVNGRELWKSDGSDDGTELVRASRPGTDPH